jgi:aerobic-type carbon monoxide dehydrogenase small subunit (CoxS/CutS family)
MSEGNSVALTINGRLVQRDNLEPGLALVDFLHEELGLTGTKFGCGIGVCRACTVAVRRSPGAPPNPVIACSTPVASLDGQHIQTVEGLAEDGALSPLQSAFLDHFAFQCGYCTPGFLVASSILLERLRAAPVAADQLDAAIADALGPHLCRCTGYVRYYQAVREALANTPGVLT